MLLYLDLNCFNRPFDDQSQERVAGETATLLSILQRIVDGIDQLVWSVVLEFENSQHPLPDRRDEIARWAHLAAVKASLTPETIHRATELAKMGISPLDAAHLACAEAAKCDRFLTCDDRLMRRSQSLCSSLLVVNPIEYWGECLHDRSTE